MDFVVKVNNLSKVYKLYDKPIDRLKETIHPFKKKYHHDFNALSGVSFEIKRGETVGVIGKNGSGKSTLLKILTGVLTPTAGEAQVNGKIAALLELGAGFNPDFTGIENVYLNGSIMGFSRDEMASKLQDILKFADIGEFANQPVKIYSSGMYVRLAFAVAVMVEPEVLIVDEALAVGDMFFQAKCMSKMRDLISKGVTVLFVSHDISSIKGLCSKCLYLENGAQVEFGDVQIVADRYIADSHLQMNTNIQSTELKKTNSELQVAPGIVGSNPIGVSLEKKRVNLPPSLKEYGNGMAEVLDFALFNSRGLSAEILEVDEEFVIQATVLFNEAMPEFAYGYSFRDLKGQMLVGSMTTNNGLTLPAVQPGEIYLIEICGKNPLREGVYTVSLGIELPIQTNTEHLFIKVLENAAVFRSVFPIDPIKRFASMVKTSSTFKYNKINLSKKN